MDSEDRFPTDKTRAVDAGDSPRLPGNPERIGAYRILERIGEGGFGEVYAAEQSEPVRRTVALKVLKAGLDTRAVLRRFEAERQTLAMMEHPGIAKVLDAGQTESGSPYFVMELVRGDSLTAHCDRHRLSTKERLELFISACRAVQHAHQKGIIHRDLKPSNILVETVDREPRPKVIDFGIAKATSSDGDRTMFTMEGHFVGTPEFMSPEQAEGALDIDTRTDVYSLGVVLYVLLTGTLPFDSEALRGKRFSEVQRILRDEDPPRPSTRVSTPTEASLRIAERRRTDLPTLSRQLERELDWVVMRCLEKDRNRRYTSPNELAEDIARYLRNDPVLAAPPDTSYRMRKFVRRHRLGVGLSGAALLVLISFATMMGVQSHRVARERDRANDEAEAAAQVAEFLSEMLGDVDAERFGNAIVRSLTTQIAEVRSEGEMTEELRKASDESLTGLLAGTSRPDLARELLNDEILERAVARVQEMEEVNPLVAARLFVTLSRTYRGLGLAAAAEETALRALDLRRARLGEEHPEFLGALAELGQAFYENNKRAEALEIAKVVHEKRARDLGPEHPATLISVGTYAHCLRAEVGAAEAESVLTPGLDAARRNLGEEAPLTQQLLLQLAAVKSGEGLFEEAEVILRDLVPAVRRVQGNESLATLGAMSALGEVWDKLSRFDEAVSIHQEALDIATRAWGSEHWRTCATRNDLSHVYSVHLNRLDLARPLLAENLRVRRRLLGDSDPSTADAMHEIARLDLQADRLDDAEKLFAGAERIYEAVRGADHPATLGLRQERGQALREAGLVAEAAAIHEDLLASSPPAEGTLRGSAVLLELGLCYSHLGRDDEAEAALRQSLDIHERERGADDKWTLYRMQRLGEFLHDAERHDEAEPVLRKALDGRRRVHGEDSPHAVETEGTLAAVYVALGRSRDARDLHENRLAVAEQAARRPDASATQLGDYAWLLLTAQPPELQDPEEALAWARRANEETRSMDPGHLDTLALAYHRTGDTATAIEKQSAALALLAPRAPERPDFERRMTEYEAAVAAGTR